MNHSRLFRALLALTVASSMTFVACKPKAKATPPKANPTPTDTSDSTKPSTPTDPKNDYPPTKETPKVDPLAGSLMDIQNKYFKDAFFDFDKYDLRDDARMSLQGDADFMKKNASIRVTIEGHCDERGTREYNLALGEKRAQAARDYLVALGVGEDRISVVSYGKEKPFAEGHDEDTWSKNRRAHFVVTAK